MTPGPLALHTHRDMDTTLDMNEDPRRWMAVVYRALVEGSLVPSDPRLIGASALRAIARFHGGEVGSLPDGFGDDVERDAAHLASLLPGEGPWWDVLQAMAWDSDAPHTSVAVPGMMARMGALMRGEPMVAPGFFLWGQPSGSMVVADVDERGSGHASGLLAGDLLLSVDGRPTGRASSEVLPFYAAVPGTRFALQVQRGDAMLPIELELLPGEIPGVSHRMLEGGVGYLSLRWFSVSEDPLRDTAAQARAALAGFAAGGARGLVIDLRSGLGGSGLAVSGVASALCEGEVMVSVRLADGSDHDLPRTADPLWLDRRLVLLINDQTMSAAEYLGLALSELAGGTLVGLPTAGGLNGLRAADLADGYQLVLPHGTALGPRSRSPLPGFRLQPQIVAPNPTPAELAAGLDPALETARRVAAGRP